MILIYLDKNSKFNYDTIDIDSFSNEINKPSFAINSEDVVNKLFADIIGAEILAEIVGALVIWLATPDPTWISKVITPIVFGLAVNFYFEDKIEDQLELKLTTLQNQTLNGFWVINGKTEWASGLIFNSDRLISSGFNYFIRETNYRNRSETQLIEFPISSNEKRITVRNETWFLTKISSKIIISLLLV